MLYGNLTGLVIPPLGQNTISHWLQGVQIRKQSYKEVRQNLKQV